MCHERCRYELIFGTCLISLQWTLHELVEQCGRNYHLNLWGINCQILLNISHSDVFLLHPFSSVTAHSQTVCLFLFFYPPKNTLPRFNLLSLWSRLSRGSNGCLFWSILYSQLNPSFMLALNNGCIISVAVWTYGTQLLISEISDMISAYFYKSLIFWVLHSLIISKTNENIKELVV